MKHPNAETSKHPPAALRLRAFAWVMAIAFVGANAVADSITFVGSPIALRNCRVQSIQGGQVVFQDPSGKRQQRSLDDVNSLSFQDMASLDDAERLIAAEDLDAGLTELMRAESAAQSDMQRLWVRSRLARIHDARGQYVEAAGHAAMVFALTDDPYWRKLEPVSEPGDTSFAAALETLLALQQASSSVRSTSLKASVDRMLGVVRPIHDRLAAAYTGPPIEPGSTISGVLKSDLAHATSPQSPAHPPIPAPASTHAGGATDSAPTPAPSSSSPSVAHELEPVSAGSSNESKSAAAIESLISQHKYNDALAMCQRIESNPGERDLCQFLWQFGRASAGSGAFPDAAVMFTRGGVLFPASPYAAKCFIEAAIIHRDKLKNVDAARRLFNRALETATALNQTDDMTRSRQALAELPQLDMP
jgi:tetratricopeptide (TPR) repeat protein